MSRSEIQNTSEENKLENYYYCKKCLECDFVSWYRPNAHYKELVCVTAPGRTTSLHIFPDSLAAPIDKEFGRGRKDGRTAKKN